MILDSISLEERKLILTSKLTQLLKLTHNYDLLKIVDFLSYEELKRCYIKILNNYNERPFYIKKNMEVGIFKNRWGVLWKNLMKIELRKLIEVLTM